MDVEIVFEDSDILVLNKPSAMTVNTSDTTKTEVTLQKWVEEYLQYDPYVTEKRDPDTYTMPEEDFKGRAGIVHRLDKETSGIILVAKNVESFVGLQRQFKERVVEKIYQALAHGKLTPEKGEIRVPVGRLPWNRKRFGVLAGGKEAVTTYTVLQYLRFPLKKGFEFLSLVELYPKTGRTHQIRVHLKHVGHPIFADFLYAGRKTARNDRVHLGRVFLHAKKITFFHPKTQKQVTCEAPIPSELQIVLDRCSIVE